MWGDTLPKNRFLRFWVLLAHRYLKHNVATQSAALAFYLLFMIFPFLIFISALLGLLNLNVAGIVSVLADFLPEVVLELTELYLTYVRGKPKPAAHGIRSGIFRVLPHAGHQLSYGRRADSLSSRAAPGSREPVAPGAALHGDAHCRHCPDADADDLRGAGAVVRRKSFPSAGVDGGTVGAPAVPGRREP